MPFVPSHHCLLPGLAEHWTGLLSRLLPPSIYFQPCSHSDLVKRQADHITTLFKTLQKLVKAQVMSRGPPGPTNLVPSLPPVWLYPLLLSPFLTVLRAQCPLSVPQMPGFAFTAPSPWDSLSWDSTCLLPLRLLILPKGHLSEAFLPRRAFLKFIYF